MLLYREDLTVHRLTHVATIAHSQHDHIPGMHLSQEARCSYDFG